MAAAGNYYDQSVEEAAQQLATDEKTGLTEAAVKERLVSFGPNQLKQNKTASPLAIFLEQFKGFIIWVLIGAALLSGFLQEWIDAAAIIAIVFVNAILGFVQEYRAEKSLAALKKLSSPTSKVIRAGQKKIIPSSGLVPGDLVELEAGDLVPADGRLVYTAPNFAVQEASLTGESMPVAKTSRQLEEKELPLADRGNMVYTGTSVVSGKARAIIVETGMKTELGRIAGMIQAIETEATPLQKKLEQFGKWIVYLCFVLVGLVFALEVWRGGEMINVLLTSVSLAVAAIPEGLPAVVTIALALGVQRMVTRHVLIRKLPSVETLGSATVICSDKTGTLTKNEMTVKVIFADSAIINVSGVGYEPKGEFLINGKTISPAAYPGLQKTLLCGVLCNGAELKRDKILGDPTEGSILVAAAKSGLHKIKLEEEYQFTEEIPFDPERKKMTIIREKEGRLYAFVKGAPDILLKDCTGIEEQGVRRSLSDQDKQKIIQANADLADQALRVLAVAYRVFEKAPAKYEVAIVEKELVFVGLVAMIDPAREEVKEAIRKCGTAGIKTIMITGDHKNTAVAIARELGIMKEGELALSGEELDQLSAEEFQGKVRQITVYARVSPENKLRIVRTWKSLGEVVAMTGDGVNDAPAVKEANIGVAMGITGTDVTKEVSDMVITDDNFASIVAAVEEGRGIYGNIRKFVHYLLSCNAGEILIMFIASLFGLPVPLLPIHILWVNLVTDGFPALALGMDPVTPDIMNRPPRPTHEPVVTVRRTVLMLVQGAFMAVCALLAFAYMLSAGESLAHARTAAFVVLACAQLFHAFNCRSQTESIFKLGVFSNLNLLYACLVSFLLLMAVVYVPFLQGIFKTDPILGTHWLLVILLSSFPLWAMEIVKIMNKKGGIISD
ncbi:MAG: calcium-translocating P-type ATPase, PMCA-type [Candidatus Margulisiibacteriota bacterium]